MRRPSTIRRRVPSYRLLVFDWDGTLMDSIGAIVACMQVTVAELGLAPIPEKAIRDTVGLGLQESLDLLVPEAGREIRQEIREVYRKHWFATFREHLLPFPGVEQSLTALADAGYLLGVATGKGRRGLDRDLAATGFGRLFNASRTAEESFSKPHPQMLLDLLDELGVPTRDALMIGDTTHDLLMARNAGTAALAVCSGSHLREALLELEPLACLNSVCEVPAWLGEHR